MIELVCNSQQNKAKRCASAVIHSGGRQILATCGMIFETLCVFAQISDRKKRNLETAKIARKYLWIPSIVLEQTSFRMTENPGARIRPIFEGRKGPRGIFFKGKRRPIEYQYKFAYPECSAIKTYQCI